MHNVSRNAHTAVFYAPTAPKIAFSPTRVVSAIPGTRQRSGRSPSRVSLDPRAALYGFGNCTKWSVRYSRVLTDGPGAVLASPRIGGQTQSNTTTPPRTPKFSWPPSPIPNSLGLILLLKLHEWLDACPTTANRRPLIKPITPTTIYSNRKI